MRRRLRGPVPRRQWSEGHPRRFGCGCSPDSAREVGWREHVTGAGDDRPLNRVLELAHVARPIVPSDQPHGVGGESKGTADQPLPLHAREVTRQERDVVSSLPERCYLQLEHREPEVEVLSKAAPRNIGREIAMRRREQTEIRTQLTVPTHPLERPLLHDPQQLRLRRTAQLPDLVQEDGPTVRSLEQARPVTKWRP